MYSDSAQKCGGVHRKMISTISQAFSGAWPVAAAQPIIGRKAPASRR
jgi:hypothetical protein